MVLMVGKGLENISRSLNVDRVHFINKSGLPCTESRRFLGAFGEIVLARMEGASKEAQRVNYFILRNDYRKGSPWNIPGRGE